MQCGRPHYHMKRVQHGRKFSFFLLLLGLLLLKNSPKTIWPGYGLGQLSGKYMQHVMLYTRMRAACVSGIVCGSMSLSRFGGDFIFPSRGHNGVCVRARVLMLSARTVVCCHVCTLRFTLAVICACLPWMGTCKRYVQKILLQASMKADVPNLSSLRNTSVKRKHHLFKSKHRDV